MGKMATTAADDGRNDSADLEPGTLDLGPYGRPNLADPDELIDALEAIEKQMAAFKPLADAQRAIRVALGNLTADEDTRTRRVRGERRKAKVVMPEDKYNKGLLAEAWNSYPAFRGECLKIAEIGLKRKEWNKVRTTNGSKAFNSFRDLIRKAYQGNPGLPTVTIEE